MSRFVRKRPTAHRRPAAGAEKQGRRGEDGGECVFSACAAAADAGDHGRKTASERFVTPRYLGGTFTLQSGREFVPLGYFAMPRPKPSTTKAVPRKKTAQGPHRFSRRWVRNPCTPCQISPVRPQTPRYTRRDMFLLVYK